MNLRLQQRLTSHLNGSLTRMLLDLRRTPALLSAVPNIR